MFGWLDLNVENSAKELNNFDNLLITKHGENVAEDM